MKKTLAIALMAALMMGMTSCLGGDESDNITRSSIYMYNMVVNSDKPSESLGLTNVLTSFEVNYSKPCISATITVMVADGLQAKFSTGELKMTAGTDAYTFSSSSITSTSGVSIKNFKGKFDPTVGMISYDFDVNDVYHVYSTASYAYNFVTMNVYDGKGGELLYTTDEVAFGFIPTAGEEECSFAISGFKLSDTSTVMSSLSYKDLTYEMVPGSGFTVKGTDLANVQGYTTYDIKDLKGEVSAQGQKGTVSFTMGDKYVEITGTMFYLN